MGAFQNYPYADVHQLNLDWIIKEVKEVKDREDEIEQAVTDSKGYAETAQESAENASQSALNASDSLTTLRTELLEWEADNQGLRDQVSTNTQNIAVDSARIDSIISGVTPDADAELIDIRIGADGTTYPTAGDAVRGQVEILSDSNEQLSDLVINDYDEQYLLDEKITTGKYWTPNGQQSTLASMKLWAAISLPAGDYFYGNLQAGNSYIVDTSTDTHTALNTFPLNADGSITISYDFVLHASATTAQNGWFATARITDAIPPKGKFNIVTELDAFEETLYGQTVTVSGSYYRKYIHNFTPSDHVRVKVVNASVTTDIYFQGLVDANDTNTAVTQFSIKAGEEYLWTPTKNFEALYWGVNGSSTVDITFTNGELDTVPKVFYCGQGLEYSTIKDAIEHATLYMDSIVYVAEGTYDIINEFGSAYFENLTASDTSLGIRLKNRVHVIFSPNSKVVCNYTGSNQYAMRNFSPFHCFENGFTLENLNIECSNVRYCIHDERNGKAEFCKSIYKNCRMKIDNRNNPYFGFNGAACIGGGLGSNAEVEINNCVFDTTAEGYGAGAYYHQSNDMSNPDHRAKVVINNNYFIHGTVTLDFSRTDASEDTDVIVSNNNFPAIGGQDSQGIWSSSITGTHTNLYAWNNIIR